MKNRALATLISSTLMAAPLAVVADPGQFFVTPFVGVQSFDGDRHAGDNGVWGVGGEYQFSEHFGTELDYAHSLDDMRAGSPKDDVDYDRLSLDGIYYFGKMGDVWQPYAKLGVGHDRYDYRNAPEDQNTDIDAGLGVRVNVTERFSWRLEAKALHEVDDSQTHGLYTFGIGYAFGGSKPAPKAAPVAAVVPPPPPPAQCPDADHDGVCDAVDQCPNTPLGTRVGPMGCDCDYTFSTHFAFNSAELNEADKVELDRLGKILVNPNMHFVTGEVYGYTDSIGKPAYNQKLSERRAQSVADYLESKGVVAGSKFRVQGFGAEDPIADNKTEAGRAENRRVVIHRTDCPAK